MRAADIALAGRQDRLAALRGRLWAETASEVALREAELEVARRSGALEILAEETGNDREQAAVADVLAAADRMLDAESRTTAAALFAEVNAEIVALARRFGLPVDRVEVDPAAQLKVIKGDGTQLGSAHSPGEQARLRTAVVIALLRIGERLGISTHPGLILIDSPQPDGVQDPDQAGLLRELADLAANNQIQVVITTTDFELTQAEIPGDCLIRAEEGGQLLVLDLTPHPDGAPRLDESVWLARHHPQVPPPTAW